MKLIQEWRDAWKFTSVQTALILALANAVFALVPALSDVVSFAVYAGISAAANIGIAVLRIVAQPGLNKPL